MLDRLLEDERLAFEGISATSAGAMNAAVLAYGLTEGGREGARKALADFWRRISHAADDRARCSRARSTGCSQDHSLRLLAGLHVLRHDDAAVVALQFNPMNFNPLRDVLRAVGRFRRAAAAATARSSCSCRATNVRTGKVKIFEQRRDLTVDAVLASACLPFMFQAVEIDGEAYWDGGYMGNPAHLPADLQLRDRATS